MRLRTLAPPGLLLALLPSCGAPVSELDRRDREGGIESVFVTVMGERGSPESPLPFSSDGVTVTLRIEARGRDNAPNPDFNGFVNVSVTPGQLLGIDGPGAAGRNVQLVGGVAEGVRVTFARSYGETRIWAEEAGYVPADANRLEPPACSDGIDNDMDGRADFPADYGCAAPNDDTERSGSYAVGASEPLFFASPSIADVQGRGTATTLLNQRVTVSSGTLIVTRISTSGFWVTDTADRSCADPLDPAVRRPCFNSIFSFNFRLPEGLRPCDRLSELQGSVQEFVSTTQFSQPAWRIDLNGGLWIDPARSGECPIPEPVMITPDMLASATADETLEPHESSMVRIENAELSQLIGPNRAPCQIRAGAISCDFGDDASNCDQNGDNRIDFTPDNDPNAVSEGECANTCQLTRGCSEWTNWLRFGQLAVDLPGQAPGSTRLIIAPREAIPNFDPVRPPETFAVAVTGTLKQVGPNWIIEPRCTQDLVLRGMGSVLPANQSCLFPRTVTEDER